MNRSMPLSMRLAACGFTLALALTVTSVAIANDCVSWDTSIGQPGTNGNVSALAGLRSGGVVAGGDFTTAGGVEANHIAHWDGTTWHPLGEGVNASVAALAIVGNGDLIAAGSFTMAGDVNANRIARWDGSQWHALGDGVDGLVHALAVMPNGDLIAGGSFTTAGGKAANNIALWDGVQWHEFGGGVDAAVHTLHVFDDGNGPTLFAGGDFITAGRVEVNHIAKWNGSTWQALDTGVNGRVEVIHGYHDGERPVLYVAGQSLSAAGYVPLFMGMARWDPSTREWSPEGDGLRGYVNAMTVFDDGTGPAVFAAATISGSGSIARWDGRWWVPVGNSVNGAIAALVSADDGDGAALYVGGLFQTVGDAQASAIAQWRYCAPLPPVVRHVPGQFSTIQAAIEASNDGDIVLVEPGTYNEAIDYLGKTITVESQAGADHTIIDATGLGTSVVKVMNGEGVGTMLRGFTITGGTASGQGLQDCGAGLNVHESSLTVKACHITGNGAWSAWAGGGLCVSLNADVLVIECTFSENVAYIGGGAAVAHNYHARFIDCTFRHNASVTGGGVNVNDPGKSMFVRTIFEENGDFGTQDYGNGGGLLAWEGVLVEHSEFHRNTVWGWGGAVVLAGGVLRNTLFRGNIASRGGGVLVSAHHNSAILNCRFEANAATSLGYGGGLHVHGIHQSMVISNTHFCGSSPIHTSGPYLDLGGNSFADSCGPILGDLNGDGVVNVSDLLILLAAFGDCPREGSCPADLNGDGVVNVSDLLLLLANWG